jgi:glycolate oxidase FAD binding subunit
VLADGTSVRFGGRTMKNVAGYDMVKLLVGSFGILGVVTEATFRLLPQPEKQVLVICPLSSLDRGRDLATWILDSPLRPLVLDVVSPGPDSTAGAGPLGAPAGRGFSEQPALLAGFAGSLAEVNRSVADVCGQAGTDAIVVLEDDQAELVYEALAESELVGEGGRGEDDGCPAVTARATLPVGEVWAVAQTAESLARAGGFSLSYRVGGARGTLDLLARGLGVETGETSFARWVGDVRGAALRAGGRLAITGGLDLLSAGFDPWGVTGSSLELTRRIKERFDPHGILSPGRFVGGI